ncbi:hypothetical protein [Haemophilus haemolyticus]|uniref:hypothetical protein n=1 Tax=Haemophilus haemolyticus TaxID=726 RepID=UPI003528427D
MSGSDGETPTKITGVAPGEISSTSKDAVNGSQLHAIAAGVGHRLGDLNNRSTVLVNEQMRVLQVH